MAVTFPDSFLPEGSPRLVVLDHEKKPDLSEQTYAGKSLFANDKTPRTLSLSINTPLPGYEYRIEWQLATRTAYEQKNYDEGALSIARAHERTIINNNEFAKYVFSATKKLQRAYARLDDADVRRGKPAFPSDVSFRVFFARTETQEKDGKKTEVALLQSIPSDGNQAICWAAGEGVVGKAQRMDAEYYFSRKTEGGAYQERNQPHTAVWAIPLRVLGLETNGLRLPIFAILCVDSRLSMHGSCELNFYSERFRKAAGEFAKSLSDELIRLRQA